MRIKFIVKLAIISMLAYLPSLHAAPPPGQGPANPPPFTTVSTSDPQVMQAANYAAQQMKSGRLVQILSAQKQGMGDVNYLLNIQVVDANGMQKTYQVEVCIP